MIDTVVIATDGSASAERAVTVAADLAGRFDAAVHALYVIDQGEVAGTPETVRPEVAEALATAGEEAIGFVRDEVTSTAPDAELVTAIREGDPAIEITSYADEVDADVIATGTRGRHGEHSFLLGSVAEAIVRTSPIPVLTVRQLDSGETGEQPA